MRRSVKLSEDLIKQAKAQARRRGRAIAEQLEHWARIGRDAERRRRRSALESVTGTRRPRGAPHSIVVFLQRLASIDSRKAVQKRLSYMRFPIYEVDPEHPDAILQIHEDGTRLRGTWDFKANRFLPQRASRTARRK